VRIDFSVPLAILSFIAGIAWSYSMVMSISSFKSIERSLCEVGLALAICQCVFVLFSGKRFQKFYAVRVLQKILRPPCMAWCLLSALVVLFGMWVWISHHGLVGFVRPTSFSGLANENGQIVSIGTPPATMKDVSLGLIMAGLQVGSFIFLFKQRKTKSVNAL
jgi:hypothetical protein